MKKLLLATIAIALSAAVGLLFASPTSLTALANMGSQRKPPTGMYVNVDAGFGSAELTMYADGRYTYGDDGSVSAEGAYTIAQDRIVFIEYRPADAACLYRRGTYRWSVDGKVLTLKAVADECPTRQYDWASGLWIRPR